MALQNKYSKKDIAKNTDKNTPVSFANESGRVKAGITMLYISAFLCIVLALYIFIWFDLVPNENYSDAVNLMKAGRYEEAIEVFESLNGFNGANEQIENCRYEMLHTRYDEALRLQNEGKYQEAIDILVSLNGFENSVYDISVCQTAIGEEKYISALSHMQNGQYTEAILIFESLNGYRESREMIYECEYLLQSGNLANIKAGDIVRFGRYEQNNNTGNGKEEIEWKVLEVKDGKALLISVYELDCLPYNDSYEEVSWETSSLRKWLNDIFINKAFGPKIIGRIVESQYDAPVNPRLSTDAGNGTKDRIAILSCEEFEKYFTDGIRESRCAPTDYAAAAGVAVEESFKYNGKACGWWWLRSPGATLYDAAAVCNDGTVNYNGGFANRINYGVRPIMWVTVSE